MIHYDPATGGFLAAGLHAIPEGAVPVSPEQHAALLAGQAAGQIIVADQDGAPMLSAPPAPTPITIRRIAPLAFRRRLSGATRQAITLAASAAMGQGDATLQTFLDDLASARFVDLDDPEVVAGVAALQTAGLVTAQEAAALLADGTLDEAR